MNYAVASRDGLVNTLNDKVYLGVDHKTFLYTNGTNTKGRKSVRVQSKNTYNEGLFIASFTHLPKNECGTWPAL